LLYAGDNFDRTDIAAALGGSRGLTLGSIEVV